MIRFVNPRPTPSTAWGAGTHRQLVPGPWKGASWICTWAQAYGQGLEFKKLGYKLLELRAVCVRGRPEPERKLKKGRMSGAVCLVMIPIVVVEIASSHFTAIHPEAGAH